MTTKKRKIIFYDSEAHHVSLKNKLEADGLTMSAFFRMIVAGYLAGDTRITTYLDRKRAKDKSRAPRKMKKEKDTTLDLKDSEIDDIFDILEKENGLL
jgi:hypothetical protein